METVGQPSFWRWMWKGSGKDWTGWQFAVAIPLALVTGAATMPLWTWLVSAFGSAWGFHEPAIVYGILIAGPGMTAAIVTAYACRPDDFRSWLLTGLMGSLVAIVGQTGAVVTLAIVFAVKPNDPVNLYALAISLAIVCLLPMLGLILAAAYFLGWRRTVGKKGIAAP